MPCTSTALKTAVLALVCASIEYASSVLAAIAAAGMEHALYARTIPPPRRCAALGTFDVIMSYSLTYTARCRANPLTSCDPVHGLDTYKAPLYLDVETFLTVRWLTSFLPCANDVPVVT